MKNTVIILICLSILFASCSFDYGQSGDKESETPDLVMENVEYVRVRSADPIARFHAERAERYEKQGVMKLSNFTFEQYGERGEEVNAYGTAGFASIEIESGNVFMDEGVLIEVESEDIILETKQLDWKDEPRTLSTPPTNEVHIYQDSGTSFTGIGLRVDARNRTYEFTGNVFGIFISTDDETEGAEKKPRTRTAPTVRRTRTTDSQTIVSDTTTQETTAQESRTSATGTTQKVGSTTTPQATTSPTATTPPATTPQTTTSPTATTPPATTPPTTKPPVTTPPVTTPPATSDSDGEDDESSKESIEEAEILKNIDPEDIPSGK